MSQADAQGARQPDAAADVMHVQVRYIFALRDGDRDRPRRLALPPGATVFEALQALGLSALELLPAVNGEQVPDATVLRDGDELILIPAIQGG